MQRPFSIAAILVAGCAAEETVWIEPPGLDGIASVIIVVDGSSAYAADNTAPILVPLPDGLTRDSRFDVTVLGYPEPHSAVGLQHGPINRQSLACSWLDSASIHSARVLAGEPVVWAALEVVPDQDASYLTQGGHAGCQLSVCRTFTQRIVPLARPRNIESLTAVDATTVIAVTADYQANRITATGASAIEFDVAFEVRSAWSAGDGNIWLGGARGEVATGPVDGPFERVRTGTVGEPIQSMWGGGEPFELFALSTNTIESDVDYRIRLFRYDGARWTTLHDVHSAIAGASQTHVRRVGDGEAIAVFGGVLLLIHRDGVTRPFDFREVTGGSLLDNHTAALEFIETFGIVVSSNSGPIYASKNPLSAWSLVSDDTRRTGSGAIAAIDRGFLAFPEFGEARQYHPGGISCPPLIVEGVKPEYAARLGDEIVLAGDVLEGAPMQVAILTPE